MKNLAIIPARSGSKGLKDKNIKELKGKPLIAYSIEAALDSGKFTEIMVSTDSEKYADIAKKYGATVPFLRSEKTSSDTASSWDTVKEVLRNYKELGKEFDSITLLQPTSPLRTSEDIINAYQLFDEKNAKAIVAMCEVEHSPLWCNTLPRNFELNGFLNKELLNSGRQRLDKYYRINGAIYIYRIEDKNDLDFSLYEENCYAYIMPQEKSIDIDTELDFKIAEVIIQ